MTVKRFAMIGVLILTSQLASAEVWTSRVASYAVRPTPGAARRFAGAEVSRQFGLFSDLCSLRQGQARTTLQNGECFPSGIEDYWCWMHGAYSCEIGTVEVDDNRSELEGDYLDAANQAYLRIAADLSFRTSVTSPYVGGTIFGAKSKFNRTAQSTYEATAQFTGVSNCEATASLKLTRLDDGGVILVVSAPERVTAVILGRCVWEGQVNAFYELAPIK